jgi:outer membrane protein TolC
LASYRFDPSDGLDATEVAMLAVAHNPGLQMARDDVQVSHAQAFAAGLLPNPVVSYGMDFPDHAPDALVARSAGIGIDLNAVLTHASAHKAARLDARSADLNLLWQEWQVVTQARLLTQRILAQQHLLDWLEQSRSLWQTLADTSDRALNAGDLGLDAAQASLVSAQEARRQVAEAQRQLRQNRADLLALLGLAPDTDLQLVDSPPEPLPDDAQIRAWRNRLPARPDLMALRTGCEAQDARYRQAILAQFPPFNLSLNKAQDNTGVHSNGFAIGFTLPVFDHNQGNIAIQQATRQRLLDEYQMRLTAASDEVTRLRADLMLLNDQLQALNASLPTLDAVATRAREAFARGDLDVATYTTYVNTAIQKHVESATLASTMADEATTLRMLTGGDFANTQETRP